LLTRSFKTGVDPKAVTATLIGVAIGVAPTLVTLNLGLESAVQTVLDASFGVPGLGN
jgi:hypothetical protein